MRAALRVFDRKRLELASSRDRAVSAVIHDEWSSHACRSFRPVVHARVGEAWNWRWYKIEEGDNFVRSGTSFHELVVASDETKKQLPGRWPRAIDGAPITRDIWAVPQRKATRFDQDIRIPFEKGWASRRIQVVQTCIVRGHQDARVGRPLPSQPEYRCFVDNGRYSPAHLGNGWPPGHPSRPYYYRPRELSDDWSPTELRYFDCPKDVERAAETYFEAAVVEVGISILHADRVLKVFKFGWIEEHGVPAARRCPEPGAKPEYKDYRTASAASDVFFEIVKLDYPFHRIRNAS